MKNKIPLILIFFDALLLQPIYGQESTLSTNNSGWFSLVGRSTISLFDHGGAGIGTGGSFRIQLNNRSASLNELRFSAGLGINLNALK